MGVLFGFIFGCMDMEDVVLKYFRNKFIKEEYYCLPIGIICGAITGLVVTIIDNNVKLHLTNIYYRNQMTRQNHFRF